MKASILSLHTALPPFALTQEEIAAALIEMVAADDQRAETIQAMHRASAIKQRYSVLDDFKKKRQEWKFWGKEFPKNLPGMAKRNQCYEKEAPKLAIAAAKGAIEEWGGNLEQITHVIAISCTGLVAPGIEFSLVRHFGLSAFTQRLAINFMGCFGAFKGLALARSLALENQQHRILVVCVELCSLHFQIDPTPDNLVANALFADGAAAVIVGAEPNPSEHVLWEIHRQSSYLLENSADKMKWEAGDFGFNLKLSHTVPVLIKKQIKSYIDSLLTADYQNLSYDWAIHPGGKSVIQAVEKALQLASSATAASWKTLREYGNMSSATFLFVLQELRKQQKSRSWTAGLAFGPGLSVEGIVMKRGKTK